MKSFYGGPAGQSFEIKAIFTSYNTNKDGKGLLDDLAKTWHSPIGVGEYVIISYGKPNTAGYNESRETDTNITVIKEVYDDLIALGMSKDAFSFDTTTQTALLCASFNGTLWQKCYDDGGEHSQYGGIYYRLITSWVSNTPLLQLAKDSPVVLNANELPQVNIDVSEANPENPKLTFYLPRSQTLQGVTLINNLDADAAPTVFFDDGGEEQDEYGYEYVNTGTEEEPILQPILGNINEPVVRVRLPQTPKYSAETTHVTASVKPSVTLNNQRTEGENAAERVNEPVFEFALPYAVQFYSGEDLGKSDNYSDAILHEVKDIRIDDYYFNQTYGHLYQVTSVNDITDDDITNNSNDATLNKETSKKCDLVYKATIQIPVPNVVSETLSPYTQKDGVYTQTEPTAEIGKAEDGNTWKVTFGLPKAPKAEVGYNGIGAAETINVDVSIKDENTLLFNFDIPQGSQIFSGIEIDDNNSTKNIEKALVGDIYLNTKSGCIYKLTLVNNEKKWVKDTSAVLKGEALNIIATYTLPNEAVTINSTTEIGNWLTLQHPDITSHDLISITWEEDGERTDYWYYCINDIWFCVQLTAGLGGLMLDSYDITNANNKTYTVRYLQNELIGAEDDENKLNVTAYSKQQVIDMLTWTDFKDLQSEEE